VSTPFSILMNSAMDGRGKTILEVPDDWSIGRTTFGGLQGAIALRAMRTIVPENSPLRTLQITFVAPVPTGRIEARAEVLRNGRNTAHVEARIMSEDQTLAVMLGVFGAGRLSEVSIVPEQPRVEMDEGTVFHFLPGDITPNCVQHFEGRWRRGAPPATGDTETKHVVDVRMRDFGLASEYHVLAIADFLPPIAFSLLPINDVDAGTNHGSTGRSVTRRLAPGCRTRCGSRRLHEPIRHGLGSRGALHRSQPSEHVRVWISRRAVRSSDHP
jgi:Thioesterase-like superfamily